MQRNLLIVNFGGPRSLDEVEQFLIALLTDEDVIRTKLPSFLQRQLFKRVAKKRSVKIREDYHHIGGKSPIYEDTEAVAKEASRLTASSLVTFHRYLPETHKNFLKEIEKFSQDEITVFPLFPQFSYATTGSIARFFERNMHAHVARRLRWIKSYAAHPAFVNAMQNCIRDFLREKEIPEEDAILFFSAHGLPQDYVDAGDIYESECRLSFHAIAQGFPKALCKLAYQSKFGRGEWLRPYTDETCQSILTWHEGRKHVVLVPISFTSDHIETLFEMEELYLPIIRENGLLAYRCPALNRRTDWLDAVAQILQETNFCTNQMLIR